MLCNSVQYSDACPIFCLVMMRQRAFLLFLTCVLLTSICVVLLPSRRRSSFHAIVKETQEKISALGEELIADEDDSSPSLIKDPTRLASLGLEGEGWPVLYPKGQWLVNGRATDPSLVSAVEPGQAELGLGLVRSVQHFLPSTSVFLFDLGLGRYERELIQRYCNSSSCSLLQFDFNPWPSHVRELHLHAYRPLILQTILRDVGSLIWLDVDYRLTRSVITSWLDQAKEGGVVAWKQGEGRGTATTSLTHPRMFEFFPGTKYEDFAFQHMASSSVLLLVYTQDTHVHLMLPWLKCALTEACINPIGAQDTGCRFDKKPQYRYSGCHRYDMSALNIVLGNMFKFQESRYMRDQTDSFFRRMTQEPGSEGPGSDSPSTSNKSQNIESWDRLEP